MPKQKVLIVDGSVTVRRRLSDAINANSRMEVIAMAPNGNVALRKLNQVRPDAIMMDISLPDMSGLDVIREVRDKMPDTSIIVFSEGLTKGCSEALDAISAGASDYVTKPTARNPHGEEWGCVEDEVIPKLLERSKGAPAVEAKKPHATKSMASQRSPVTLTNQPVVAEPLNPSASVGDMLRSFAGAKGDREFPVYSGQPKILCIGSSTGGPNALAALFSSIPRDFPLPIAIVQHMPPQFTEMLAVRLNALNSVAFHEAEAGMIMEPGHAYIAPGGKHMTVEKEKGFLSTSLNMGPPENSCRPAVDVMFRSVVGAVGGAAISVILTGMGKDGYCGGEYIREAGGSMIAQDEETSVVWGMPGYVATGGLANEVLPLDDIAEAIMKRVKNVMPPGKN